VILHSYVSLPEGSPFQDREGLIAKRSIDPVGG
jgi:hypothetical protein